MLKYSFEKKACCSIINCLHLIVTDEGNGLERSLPDTDEFSNLRKWLFLLHPKMLLLKLLEQEPSRTYGGSSSSARCKFYDPLENLDSRRKGDRRRRRPFSCVWILQWSRFFIKLFLFKKLNWGENFQICFKSLKSKFEYWKNERFQTCSPNLWVIYLSIFFRPYKVHLALGT